MASSRLISPNIFLHTVPFILTAVEWLKNLSDQLDPEFLSNLEKAWYGDSIFLKKYKPGYALKHIESDHYVLVMALRTPLEQIIADFSIIKTAILG